MKKMQCEVCGSTEIKKVSGDIFECQSCGLQYSKDEVKKLLVEVTGEVKINRADEIDNTLKRAEQFKSEGNVKKAEQYYEKVLDMDAENAKATQILKEIRENKKVDAFKVIEANIPSDYIVESFLKELAIAENVACDIYKEIEILSVTKKYRPAFFSRNRCRYQWTATACHTYYENETVWKEKYNVKTDRYEKVPETKKVERVNRVPANGVFDADCNGFGFVSDAIKNSINNVGSTDKKNLVESFEELQGTKFTDYKIKKIDNERIKKENGKMYYNDIEIDFLIDTAMCEQKRKTIVENGDTRNFERARNSVGGDFYENFNCRRQVIEHSIEYILIPVQVIEYAYKNNSYAAVVDLVSQTTTMTKLYPCDTAMTLAKDEVHKAEEAENHSCGIYVMGIIGLVAGAISLGIAAMFDSDKFGYGAFGIWLLSIFILVIGYVFQRSRHKEYVEKSDLYKKEIFEPRKIALTEMYQEFFKAFEVSKNVAEARGALPDSSVSIENVMTCLAPAGEEKEFVVKTQEDVNEQELEIRQLEYEIEQLKKKRIVPILLMTVFGVLFVTFIIGVIMLGNVNAEINKKQAEIGRIRKEWENA